VSPAEAPERAETLAELPGVRFRGIRSHTGHAYRARTIDARRAIAYDDARTMAAAADAIRARGLECAIVSVGSTPGTAGLADATAWEGVSEWRPGSYAFLDRMQVSIGCGTLDDCALRVVTSVVSAAEAGRALVDAGKKTLTATVDPFTAGYGAVVGRPNVEIHALSEECGWLRYDGAPLRVGERLAIVPNHACELTNLVEVVAYGTDGVIEGTWVPVARAKVW
jgi:D-serine deaminase-like pyridoxal phosphate-dependent protein